ncbi:MAG TPA: alpha/beta hydrolase [Caldithrix abyssi]|uniref:Alpha/beta hydrolase n=1 Tax=Caldithrix abyssi TaxID=187145 RepID=A0A7V4WVT5_CALAY|nr:alpha/beta hydrolase [Caldithrix abyssi]
MRVLRIIVFLSLFSALYSADFKTVTFPSQDSLEITADLYMPHPKSAPFIILFHRAHWSRGEYREIAPKLNAMGFNCLAVDQRSGNEVNGVKNETAARALALGKPTTYVDALQDMQAALDFVRKNYVKGKLIIWGSSYSSSLALVLAGQNEDVVDGVLAFAPGEYFLRLGKPKNYVQIHAKRLDMPVFITSAKKEAPNWKAIFEVIPSRNKVSFIPKTAGIHGSQALWESTPDNAAYWTEVNKFLMQFLE